MNDTFRNLGVNWIALELNNTCNLRCSYCPMSKPELQRSPKNKILDKDTALRLLQEIKDDGTIEYVVLNDYGEPFLYPYFKDVLSYCKEHDIKIRFGTNGTLFTRQNIELLKQFQPEEIVISIQYFMEEQYKKVRGTNIDREIWLNQIADFLKVHMANNLTSNIQLAVADNMMNSIKHRVCGLRLGDTNIPYPNKKYYRQLNGFIKDFCENKLGLQFDDNNIKIIRKSDYSEYYKINSKIAFEIKHFFDLTNIYNYKENNQVDCQMSYLVVNANGDVLMCCVDYTGETSLGNIREKSIKEILLENYHIFANKNNEKAKIKLCRRCYGERTYRGLWLKKIYQRLKGRKSPP